MRVAHESEGRRFESYRAPSKAPEVAGLPFVGSSCITSAVAVGRDLIATGGWRLLTAVIETTELASREQYGREVVRVSARSK